jgi:hypothetical protein
VPKQVTVVGDFEPEQLEKHFKDFLGTVGPRKTPLALPHAPITFTYGLPIPQRHLVCLLSVFLPFFLSLSFCLSSFLSFCLSFCHHLHLRLD